MKYKTSPEHEFLKLLGDLEYNWKTRTLNLLSLHRVIQKKFLEVRTSAPIHFESKFRKDWFSSFTILILTWMISEVDTVFYYRVSQKKGDLSLYAHGTP